MKWVNILHLYQPPTQTKEIVDAVVLECYQRIIFLLDSYPNLRLTLNISGSLLELLMKYGHENIIAGFKKHAERGSVEFLGSAMYHPILPLLPNEEIIRQIRLHDKISKKCFGSVYKPRGFYLPEMAYNQKTATIITDAGFEWIILDEIHTLEKINPSVKYKIKGLGLGIIFRDSSLSRTFPPEFIVTNLEKIKNEYIVTCHDGEMYGHWHKDDRGYYKKAFTNDSIKMLTVSEYRTVLFGEENISVRDASWESKPEELSENMTFGLWNDPRNKIHNMLETFKRKVLILVESHQNSSGYEIARHYADRGVASCAWWWASERKIGPFSPRSWNPTEIEKGARELYKAVTALDLPEREFAETSSLFENLRKTIWEKHKQDYDPNYLIE
ncbi:MAG: hypothetical protein Q7R72_01975 [bacterium]|nr:hypothetical protein [bacterium]